MGSVHEAKNTDGWPHTAEEGGDSELAAVEAGCAGFTRAQLCSRPLRPHTPQQLELIQRLARHARDQPTAAGPPRHPSPSRWETVVEVARSAEMLDRWSFAWDAKYYERTTLPVFEQGLFDPDKSQGSHW